MSLSTVHEFPANGLDLLTYRLTGYMNQVAANQMKMFIIKEKIQNEKPLHQDQLTRIEAKNKIHMLLIEEIKSKLIGFRDLMSKKNDEKQSSLDGDNVRITQTKFGALMGVSSGLRKNLEEKENSATLARTRFLKASKMTVMINSMKQGQVLCTCSSVHKYMYSTLYMDCKCAKNDS